MGERIRVLTANLWNGGADADAFAELVAACEVDVACLQELAPEQAEALDRVLPHGILEPARDHSGGGLALRRAARLRRLELPCRDARVAELDPRDWPGLGSAVEVIGVHISGPLVWPYWRAMRQRRAQLRVLERYLDEAPACRRVLAGDLNATPAWPLYRRLARRLRDVHTEVLARRGGRAARTWGPTPRWPRLLRIDHVLAQRLHAEDARVIPIRGSDHSAVIVDLVAHPRNPG